MIDHIVAGRERVHMYSLAAYVLSRGLPQVLSQVEEKVNKQQYLGSMLRITVTKKQR
jgi:hypothetical protein